MQYADQFPNGFQWVHKAGRYHKFSNGVNMFLVSDSEFANGWVWTLSERNGTGPDHTISIDKYNHGVEC